MAPESNIFSGDLGGLFSCTDDWTNVCYGWGDFNVIDTSFDTEHKLQQPNAIESESLPSENKFVGFPEQNSATIWEDDSYSSNTSSDMEVWFDKQIDAYINLEAQKMGFAVEQLCRQHQGALKREMEAKAVALLNQKDEGIARANKRILQLQRSMRLVEAENRSWQRIAAENEAMIISLNSTISQLREQNEAMIMVSRGAFQGIGVDDLESCCESNCATKEEEEELQDKETVENGG